MDYYQVPGLHLGSDDCPWVAQRLPFVDGNSSGCNLAVSADTAKRNEAGDGIDAETAGPGDYR